MPLLVHSFKFVGKISLPKIPLINVDFPAFDGPKNGIKITLYIFKKWMNLAISSVRFLNLLSPVLLFLIFLPNN